MPDAVRYGVMKNKGRQRNSIRDHGGAAAAASGVERLQLDRSTDGHRIHIKRRRGRRLAAVGGVADRQTGDSRERADRLDPRGRRPSQRASET